ncbi:MAG: hypothetical protein ACUVTD_00650 [Nitrososphaerales archaeon]
MVLGIDAMITIVVSVASASLVTFLASSHTIKTVATKIEDSTRSITNGFAHKFIAMGYAQSKASKEGRVLSLEDMKEGFDFADKVLKSRI